MIKQNSKIPNTPELERARRCIWLEHKLIPKNFIKLLILPVLQTLFFGVMAYNNDAMYDFMGFEGIHSDSTLLISLVLFLINVYLLFDKISLLYNAYRSGPISP